MSYTLSSIKSYASTYGRQSGPLTSLQSSIQRDGNAFQLSVQSWNLGSIALFQKVPQGESDRAGIAVCKYTVSLQLTADERDVAIHRHSRAAMSFCFPSWSTAFSPAFHEDAKAMLEGALNKVRIGASVTVERS